MKPEEKRQIHEICQDEGVNYMVSDGTWSTYTVNTLASTDVIVSLLKLFLPVKRCLKDQMVQGRPKWLCSLVAEGVAREPLQK